MPIMSFGSQNINIITHKKAMTIRKLWKNPLKVGDRLHCYWNLVSKEKKKIFEAEVTDVKTLPFKEIKNNDKLAQEEGYIDAKDMVREFKKMYLNEISDDDLFQIIYFEKLDLDKWKGEKIDQKEMITQRADILFDTGKYDKSTLCYDAALRIDPSDVYLLNKQGDNLTRLNRFDEAIECYDKALAIDAMLNSGNVEEALKASDSALKANPDSAVVLYWRGFILEILSQFDQALEVYDKLLKIDDTNPEVWNARGNLLTDMDRAEEALESYDKALELCLDDSELDATAQNRKGNALMELLRFEEAIECYDKAISLEPHNTSFLLNKGVVLMELGNFAEAENIFTKVLAIDPSNDDARVLKMECLENM